MMKMRKIARGAVRILIAITLYAKLNIETYYSLKKRKHVFFLENELRTTQYYSPNVSSNTKTKKQHNTIIKITENFNSIN